MPRSGAPCVAISSPALPARVPTYRRPPAATRSKRAARPMPRAFWMRAERAYAGLAVALSIGATLLALEIGARILTGSLASSAPAAEMGEHWLVDPDLGYVLRDDLAVQVREGYEVHTRSHGIRTNGDGRPSRERPVTLVVGDSFAFGDEVLDSETWPAVLERAIDAPVIN